MGFFESSANWIALVVSVVGIVYAWRTAQWVLAQSAGNDTMAKIASAIQEGAQAFLQREYRYVGMVVAGVTVLLLVLALFSNLSVRGERIERQAWPDWMNSLGKKIRPIEDKMLQMSDGAKESIFASCI